MPGDHPSKAIALSPQSIEAHYYCGLAAEKLGRHTIAQDCYTTVVKLRSSSFAEEVSLPELPTPVPELQQQCILKKLSIWRNSLLPLFIYYDVGDCVNH
ncbi:MAG: hypothetical protein HC930_13670 [Hydrococcus sp. SU_1_0]|nr:hypothetical protein [Hydrococcus sp. SU_1_0]